RSATTVQQPPSGREHPCGCRSSCAPCAGGVLESCGAACVCAAVRADIAGVLLHVGVDDVAGLADGMAAVSARKQVSVAGIDPHAHVGVVLDPRAQLVVKLLGEL